MADDSVIVDGTKDQMVSTSQELARLAKFVSLAAFACEARRVLTGLSDLCQLDPALDARLAQNIEAKNEWALRDDVSGDVLNLVSERLSELSEGMEIAAYGLHELQMQRRRK